jgi:alkylmercury lyase
MILARFQENYRRFEIMNNTRLLETVKKLQERLLEYGPDHTRLLLQVIRQLAHGHPITAGQVDHLIADLGIAREKAHQFLREVTERDETDQIVGAMGLSLSDHPHRLSVAGVSLSAWCAQDTLFLPTLLGQTATIESPSPVTHQPIRLRVSPERVEEVNPTGAVLSSVLVDPNRENMASVEAIWSTFCEHIHFFATREEGEQWASVRDDIVLLTVEEGFAWGRQVWSRVFPDLYAA